jgi:YjjG family noncanonical pyrimidine nucleotidase
MHPPAQLLTTKLAPPSASAPARGPRYRWLLFDADGTLFDYERAEARALTRAFELSGVSFAPEYLPVYRRINQSLWQALERKETSPQTLKTRRFELLLEELGLALRADKLSVLYLRCLADCSELVEGAYEVLEALHGQYRVAILTNGLQAVQRPRLSGSRIRDYVTELIISEEIGGAKPAREFFDAAFARLGQPAKAETLMIGDGWGPDIQGAMEYGIDACWYNPSRRARPSELPITREIVSLRELPGWLEGLAATA